MTPPSLLIQQLRRAHSIFLLHHAPDLDTLYESAGKSAFCLFLENFWLRYAWNWEVLLSGNPAVEIYNGIKLSAGGELGVGVVGVDCCEEASCDPHRELGVAMEERHHAGCHSFL